jgi:hypothetical protein
VLAEQVFCNPLPPLKLISGGAGICWSVEAVWHHRVCKGTIEMLTAKYVIRLPAPIHIATSTTLFFQDGSAYSEGLTETDLFTDDSELRYIMKVDAFDVALQLHHDLVRNPRNRQHQHEGLASATVTVASVGHTANDLENDRTNTEPAFSLVAFNVLNRFIDYCRYELGHAFMRPANFGDVESTEWVEAGMTLKPGQDYLVADNFPGLPGQARSLGSKSLTPSRRTAVLQAIAAGVQPQTEQELLSFARDAIYEGHIRQAVLFLAISCEVAIKTRFFQEDTPAAAVFEYFEDRRKGSISSVELISSCAERVFGESFKDHDSDAHQDIDHLFRARNKVAHRARAEYRDDGNILRSVDEGVLYQWWSSATALIGWLATLSR